MPVMVMNFWGPGLNPAGFQQHFEVHWNVVSLDKTQAQKACLIPDFWFSFIFLSGESRHWSSGCPSCSCSAETSKAGDNNQIHRGATSPASNLLSRGKRMQTSLGRKMWECFWREGLRWRHTDTLQPRSPCHEKFPHIQTKLPWHSLRCFLFYPSLLGRKDQTKPPGSSLLFQDIHFLLLLPSFENLLQEEDWAGSDTNPITKRIKTTATKSRSYPWCLSAVQS